ncbi:hypothetical protein IFM89_003635 [Coptis chinensis]|uniref:UBR-type domain-containing protein n=1 Tax=Coptis chinensis TaxID=261450 RepID=A0A835IUX3_9MAGN|nr:hypothetical protein IFM89_003635 [Coptis chinensis]
MADIFDDETEQMVSIQDFLQNAEDEELEADLVLGGYEGKECTYNNDYMKRQAVFPCLTCVPDRNAGVCTACSLSCHDGHEIVELWTKRNFICDCGNSKFGEFYCKLFASKDPENSENTYNQTSKGSYCTCGHPYPDPEAEEQVEMIVSVRIGFMRTIWVLSPLMRYREMRMENLFTRISSVKHVQRYALS